jgi:RluA family pseudouridine synthase
VESAAALTVLGENPLCLCVDKPAGLPTIPDRAGRTRGVHGLLVDLRPEDDLRVAHRLDRDTSGCLALAKGLEGARWLDEAFRGGHVLKEYLALVEGRVARGRFVVDKALGPDPKRPGKVVTVGDGSKRSRSARTEVEIEERFARHTLLRIRPRTGRGHQIRVHLRSIGHPIVGDVDYGASGPLFLSSFKAGYKLRPGVPEQPLLERMFLHAEHLRLPMPEGWAPLDVRAPVPDDLARVLRQLTRFSSLERRRGGSCA